MITFYPRDIALWRDHFDFDPPITLTLKEKTNLKVFRNHTELKEFLKAYSVKFNDVDHPVEFIGPKFNHFYDKYMYTIKSTTVVGAFTDDYKD